MTKTKVRNMKEHKEEICNKDRFPSCKTFRLTLTQTQTHTSVFLASETEFVTPRRPTWIFCLVCLWICHLLLKTHVLGLVENPSAVNPSVTSLYNMRSDRQMSHCKWKLLQCLLHQLFSSFTYYVLWCIDDRGNDNDLISEPVLNDDDKELTVEVFVVVLLCPQTVLDDQAIRPREVRNSCRIEVPTWK